MIVRVCAALFSLALLTACSSPSAAQQTEQQERALMDQLKTKYPDVVMGFDFHGAAVDVSIDPNGMIALGDDGEAAMKAAVLQRWKSTWIQTHPGAHTTVTVHIIDFRGRPYYNASTKA